MKTKDLSQVENSLTSYIKKNLDTINTFSTKEQIINFIKTSRDNGVAVSQEKINQIIYRINSYMSFNSALKYLYDVMLAGSNLGVV